MASDVNEYSAREWGEARAGELVGRKALVTGGASGIGLAVASRFAAEGARVVLTDRDEELGRAVAAELGATFLRIDVADREQISRGFREAAAVLDGLDLLHLNAGTSSEEPDFGRMSEKQYRHLMAVDVDHVVFGVGDALGLMGGRGDILVTAGLVGLGPYSPDPVYAMAKHAVIGLVKSLAPTLAEREISLNAICPGVVRTPMLSAQGAAFFEAAGVTLLEAEDVAVAALGAIRSGRTGESWICRRGEPPALLGDGVTREEIEDLLVRMNDRIKQFMAYAATTR
jgi:NAD(P)-dependent dehydrogenase (short-subunit alcohol dehydrogenase family)